MLLMILMTFYSRMWYRQRAKPDADDRRDVTIVPPCSGQNNFVLLHADHPLQDNKGLQTHIDPEKDLSS